MTIRVLHLIPSLGGGGAERQVAYLAEGMCKRGLEVHVATLRGGPHLPRVLAAGAHVHRINARGNYDPLLVPRIFGLVRSVRPHIVQTWLTQSDVLGGVAAMTLRIPWILSERTSPQFLGRDIKTGLRHFLGRFADVIIANSKTGMSYWGKSRAKKFVIPNAVDIEAIDSVAPGTIDGLDGHPVVLYAGRLEKVKNVETLVPALCDVVRAKDVVALVCGDGPKASAMREQIERAGCADRIRMLGFTDAVWRLMKRADVLVSPSWLEGHPNVVIEAAIAGCPLVLSDIPQHRAFLDDRSATFAPPGDAAAIANAITSVLDDAAAAKEKAQRARAAVEGWSIERITSEYVNIYEELLR